MAHGTRGRLVRVAVGGVGLLICTGLVGCMNTDKKKDQPVKQPTGLTGTPTLGANGQPIAKNGTPANQFGTGNGIQQAGGVTRPGGLGSTPPPYSPPGVNMNAPANPNSSTVINPPAQTGTFAPPVTPYPPQSTNTTAPPYQQMGSTSLMGALDPLPPSPPPDRPAAGSQFAAVQPPSSLAPVAPPTPPAIGKGDGRN